MNLGKGKDIILSDTVGFISQLPHHLVASFRATLQEVIDANLLLHIVDASDKEYETHIEDVETVLQEIKADGILSQIVFNKIDLISDEIKEEILEKYPESLMVSAGKEQGLDILLDEVDRKLNIALVIKILVPHAEQKTISHLNELGIVLERAYQDDGVLMEVLLNEEDVYKFKQWKI